VSLPSIFYCVFTPRPFWLFPNLPQSSSHYIELFIIFKKNLLSHIMRYLCNYIIVKWNSFQKNLKSLNKIFKSSNFYHKFIENFVSNGFKKLMHSIHLGFILLRTTNDVQLGGYVFGEWRCVSIVYVMETQLHLWDICCMTLAYVYSSNVWH